MTDRDPIPSESKQPLEITEILHEIREFDTLTRYSVINVLWTSGRLQELQPIERVKMDEEAGQKGRPKHDGVQIRYISGGVTPESTDAAYITWMSENCLTCQSEDGDTVFVESDYDRLTALDPRIIDQPFILTELHHNCTALIAHTADTVITIRLMNPTKRQLLHALSSLENDYGIPSGHVQVLANVTPPFQVRSEFDPVITTVEGYEDLGIPKEHILPFDFTDIYTKTGGYGAVKRLIVGNEGTLISSSDSWKGEDIEERFIPALSD
jgi:hypothetical protein